MSNTYYVLARVRTVVERKSWLLFCDLEASTAVYCVYNYVEVLSAAAVTPTVVMDLGASTTITITM